MDTDDPVYEIDLTDQDLAPPERRSSRREALGLLAGTVVVAGTAGRFLVGDKGKPVPEQLAVQVVRSITEQRDLLPEAVSGASGASGASGRPVAIAAAGDRSFEAVGETVNVWQTSDVEHLHVLTTTQMPAGITSLVARPPRGHQVAVAGSWGAAVMDVSDIHRPTTQALMPATGGDFRPCTAFSPDGRLVAACDMNQVALWDMGSRTVDLTSRRTVPAILPRFVFIANDILAVAQTGDATIQFWKASRSPTALLAYTGPVGQEVSLAMNPDGTLTVIQARADQSTTQVLRISKT